MKYKFAIFDLDGTILDTLDDLTDALNYALRNSGYPKRSKDEVRQFVGNGIRRLIELGVPECTPEAEINKVHSCFTDFYRCHCEDKTKAYDGITNMLEQLKDIGMHLAVVSNKADYAVGRLCEKYFSGIFDAAVGEREGIRRKPAPDSVNELLRTFGYRREESVYIGDSDVDMKTAQNAGVKSIGVAWGFRGEEELKSAGADYIIRTPQELVNLL